VSRGPDREVETTDVLSVFVASSDPAFFVSEIADELDTSRETVRNRLQELIEDGYVERKTPTERTAMYWITPAGYEYYVEMTDGN
jgi:predicted transcriptional regulator